jgi:hypothetical protein
LAAVGPLAGQDKTKPQFPGPTDKGFLLPNGWTITPAGKHIPLTDLPLNIIPLKDGRHALVATSGYNKHQLSLVDLTALKVVDQQTVFQSWFGLALAPQEEKVWWSGGGAGLLHCYSLAEVQLQRTGPEEVIPSKEKKDKTGAEKSFKSGLLLDGNQLYSLDINAGTLSVIDLKSGAVLKKAVTDSDPHITYDPVHRPTVANLLLLAALAGGTTPEAVADEIGSGGSAKLKAYVTDAVNEHFRPIRARRAEFAADPSVVRAVLDRGNEIARETARTTLREVHELMHL